jgi:hypothetical protein
LLTVCPSVKAMRTIWPLIWLRTVTVASDATVPSALTVTLMSPLCTGAVATGGVCPNREPRCAVGCGRW